ncbi:MAG: ABC transporter permease [Candidatus Saccharibacteria bacterium]|nr:ABC transporter permease [Candidatus Saccharibacteria bacterium]
MLRLTDTMRLAGTKLRTRKIRTSITVIISGLLFALLTAALVLTQSALDSLARFDKGSLNDRYFLMSAIMPRGVSQLEESPEVMKRAETLNKQRITDRQAAAKRLGIPYDAGSEPPLTHVVFEGTPPQLNTQNPSARQALAEAIAARPRLSPEELGQAATSHGAIKAYANTTWALFGTTQLMKNGKETFEPATEQTPFSGEPSLQEQLEGAAEGSQQILDDSLLQPFLLDNRPPLGQNEIPIVINYSHAETFLGLTPLNPGSATPQQRIERLTLLRQKAGELTYQLCYRNPASRQLVSTALEQQQAAAAQKKTPKPDYQAPALQYQLPAPDSCGAVTISKDTRDSETKRLDRLKAQFDAQFEPKDTREPVQHKLTFRVVGLMPSEYPMNEGSSLSDVMRRLVAPQFAQGGWIIPRQLLQTSGAHSLVTQLMTESKPSIATLGSERSEYIYEFATADQARTFRKTADCFSDDSRREGLCSKGSLLLTYPVGSSALVIDDARQLLTPVTFWTFLGVTVLAAFILLIIIARTIADSRRESAVFRALGATRFTISQIYLTYAVFLAILTALFGIGLGLLATWFIDQTYRSELTTTAQLIMAPRDPALEFHVFSIDLKSIGLIALGILVAALLACALPLIRNTRRNPIKDMRDE